MKKNHFLSIALIVALILLSGANANAQAPEETWENFSKNLVKAFQIPNDGLHVSAMQNIRIYSELYPGKLDVGDATFDIMRIFRNHKNPRMRRLALVTLVTIGNDKIIAFLKRNGELELDKEECINKQCCCAAAEYYAKKTEEDESKFLAKTE